MKTKDRNRNKQKKERGREDMGVPKMGVDQRNGGKKREGLWRFLRRTKNKKKSEAVHD